MLPMIQWTRNFLKEQGLNLDTEIKEDNRSTMLLMKNGKMSSGKRTDIIKLSHCLSENMIADFFYETNPRTEICTDEKHHPKCSGDFEIK